MNHKKCAFLTMQNSDGWSIDADLAIPYLQDNDSAEKSAAAFDRYVKQQSSRQEFVANPVQ